MNHRKFMRLAVWL